MKFGDLFNIRIRDAEDLVIAVKKPYPTIGGTPYTEVKAVFEGFDWDKGKIFIYPENDLYLVKDIDADEINTVYKKNAELNDQVFRLQLELKILKRKLKE